MRHEEGKVFIEKHAILHMVLADEISGLQTPIEALRIFGSAHYGFRTLPNAIEALLIETGLVLLALASDEEADIPGYWCDYYREDDAGPDDGHERPSITSTDDGSHPEDLIQDNDAAEIGGRTP
ncbi:hypothetical protein F5Y09DRAFT_342363 [Xylaria sp. FL1042]|nr:hypothetical protein F5Y09DRAFT_342363 [Xylaria sp. FL1042]